MSPKAVEECVESVLADNPEYSEDRAYAICTAMQQRGELDAGDDASHDELLQALADSDGACPAGQVSTGDACVPLKHVNAPPSILSTPQHLTLKSLETEPIERVEEGEDTVRYRSLKLLSPGIWADAGSETETYYPPDGIANLSPDYDDAEHDGPPVNIMHDLEMESFEAHEASVAGHVDPDTLDTDDDGNLFGDVVFDTSNGAGQYADENLQSTLEKEGAVGFGGPSVEIPARGLEQSHDEVRDMPRVDGGLLTGVAMVMDPASKSVNFAREAARRPVALSSSGDNVKVLSRQRGSMRKKLLKNVSDRLLADTADEVRETLDMFGFDDLDEMTDDEVIDMAEDLHEDLMEQVGSGGEDTAMADGIKDDAENIADEVDIPVSDVMEVLDVVDEIANGQEMETHDGKDEDEDDDEDEDAEMADGDDMQALQERVQSLANRLEDLEDAMSQAMQADDVESTLEDAKGQKLAAAETVEELEAEKEELNRRLKALEEQGKESKTMADAAGTDDVDYTDAESGITYDPATGSMSGR